MCLLNKKIGNHNNQLDSEQQKSAHKYKTKWLEINNANVVFISSKTQYHFPWNFSDKKCPKGVEVSACPTNIAGRNDRNIFGENRCPLDFPKWWLEHLDNRRHSGRMDGQNRHFFSDDRVRLQPDTIRRSLIYFPFFSF